MVTLQGMMDLISVVMQTLGARMNLSVSTLTQTDKETAHMQREVRIAQAQRTLYSSSSWSRSHGGSDGVSCSNDSDMDEETKPFLADLPDEVKCLRTAAFMTDPWVAADEYSYEV